MGKDSNRTYSNYYDSKWRHDACSDSDDSCDDDWDSSSASDFGSSRKDKARKIAARQRKAGRVEKRARAKYFGESYEPSPIAIAFIPLSQCTHCEGVHYGKPWQDPKERKADGRLSSKGCPLQDEFAKVYGETKMKEMIKEGIRCGYPITDGNGFTVACNGQHPRAIHDKVMWKNAGEEKRELSDELLKRIYMAELPWKDAKGNEICGHKMNDPPNERCFLRCNKWGKHVCGRESHLSISGVRRMSPIELHGLDDEAQKVYLWTSKAKDRMEYFRDFCGLCSEDALEAV